MSSEELAQLDYKAVREGNNVVDLSEGQKIMLRAGLAKLRILTSSLWILQRVKQELQTNTQRCLSYVRIRKFLRLLLNI